MPSLRPCTSIPRCPSAEPSLTPHRLKANGQLDFTDPKAVMQLTKTLLMVNFGLKIELPDDRLCPPVRSTRVICLLVQWVIAMKLIVRLGSEPAQLHTVAEGTHGFLVI